MTRSKVKDKVTTAWKPVNRSQPSVLHGTNFDIFLSYNWQLLGMCTLQGKLFFQSLQPVFGTVCCSTSSLHRLLPPSEAVWRLTSSTAAIQLSSPRSDSFTPAVPVTVTVTATVILGLMNYSAWCVHVQGVNSTGHSYASCWRSANVTFSWLICCDIIDISSTVFLGSVVTQLLWYEELFRVFSNSHLMASFLGQPGYVCTVQDLMNQEMIAWLASAGPYQIISGYNSGKNINIVLHLCILQQSASACRMKANLDFPVSLYRSWTGSPVTSVAGATILGQVTGQCIRPILWPDFKF